MVKRRRASFERAHALLQELRTVRAATLESAYATPNQLRPLRSLQALLIKEITRAERKTRRSKLILKSLDASGAPEAAAAISKRIEEYRHLAYVWRCFGDAVAFLFLDKFGLKQTFFSTHNMHAKQDAGFLADKAGLSREWSELEAWLDRGVPALLSDLTNTIRHGDLCLMLASDPILIEVKSGEIDRRGRRQQMSINQLAEFFATDKINGLRGLGELRRVTHPVPEVVYVDHLNECIASALSRGAAWCSPEEGLYYVAITDSSINVEHFLSQLNLAQPMVFSLNEVKAHRGWSPYSPFTLSIRDEEALFRFIWGDVYLLVLYEPAALRTLAEARGFEIEFQFDEDYALEITRPGQEGKIGLASQMLHRLAFDFTSPAWLLHTTLAQFESATRPHDIDDTEDTNAH